MQFVSRAGEKLEHALNTFKIDVTGKTCADFGSSTGGFVDCLLQHGATKVYAVETGYGTLDWKLRNDPRVELLERKNALHITLPEKMDIITIDTGWTKLEHIIPNAIANLKTSGWIIALLKPHYEADKRKLKSGVLPTTQTDAVVKKTIKTLEAHGVKINKKTASPLLGKKGGNQEFLLLIRPKPY